MQIKTIKNAGYRWVIMIINVLICALAYAGLTAWSMAATALAETFQISATVTSLGSSVFMLGYGVGSFVENYIAIKKGYRFAGILGLTLMVVGCFGIPVAPNYGIVLVCRFIQGWGILWLVGVNSTSAWFPPSQRGFASGIASSGNAIGIGCGGLLVTLLIKIAGDWQGAFRIFGIIMAVGAVAWAILMRNPPEGLYPEDAPAKAVAASDGKAVNPYKTVAAWLCVFCMIALLWQALGFLTITGTFMTGIGYSSAQGATVILFTGLVGIIAPVICGAISDSLAKKMEPVRARVLTQAAYFIIAIVSTAMFPFVAEKSYAAALLCAVLVGNTQGINATVGAMPLDLLDNQEAANKMFALTCLVGLGGGGVIAPLIASFSMENFGGTNAMFVVAGGALLGLLVTVVLPKFRLRKS